MINSELRQKIEPYLRIHIPKEYYNRIDEMLKECYLTVENGKELVTVNPLNLNRQALQFSTVNGALSGMVMWDEVKNRGRLL